MEYGKFNSAEELLKGYAELEKSFTQKCQELSALKQDIQTKQQSGTNDQPSPHETVPNCGTNGQPSPQDAPQSVANDEASTVPTQFDADSQQSPSQSACVTPPPKVMTGGGNVSMALPNRPKTLKEASELAKKYFK